MKIKKVVTIILLAAFLFSISTPALAKSQDQKESSIGIIWNEETGESQYYSLSNPPKIDPILDPLPSKKDLEKSKSTKTSVVTPQSLLPVLVRYDQNSATLDWEEKYVGVTRVDNSDNLYTSAKLIFMATESDSWEYAGTTSLETSAELELILSKVQATVTVSGTASRSWTKGYTYGTETEVPPGKIGTVTAYIPGTSSSGYAVYKVYNTYDDTYFYDYRARGAIIPAKNAWNMKVKIS